MRVASSLSMLPACLARVLGYDQTAPYYAREARINTASVCVCLCVRIHTHKLAGLSSERLLQPSHNWPASVFAQPARSCGCACTHMIPQARHEQRLLPHGHDRPAQPPHLHQRIPELGAHVRVGSLFCCVGHGVPAALALAWKQPRAGHAPQTRASDFA